MKLAFASLTDKGQVRLQNEDALGYCEPSEEKELSEKGAIFIVADGMGGHQGGEIASKLAVDKIIASYYASKEKNCAKALVQAFSDANKAILDKSINDVSLFGMGTTCTAMVIRQNEAFFAHVGDSRAYALRKEKFKQITEDHSLVGEMVRSGILSDEDALNHPKRNVITRSLGTQEDISADTPSSPYPILDGDVFLLCSDGLTTFVSEDEIKLILQAKAPKDACQELVSLANSHGGKDNITVQVIHVSEGD